MIRASRRSDPQTDGEIQTAKADVACRKQVDLIRIWASVDIAYQGTAILQHRPQLEAVRKYLDAVCANARRILAQQEVSENADTTS